MKISDITETTINEEIELFKRLISSHIFTLMSNFLPVSSVDFFKQQLQQYNYDSFIKAILNKIFLFARGEITLSNRDEETLMQQACDTICSIMWSSPASAAHCTINWTEWVKTPLGFAIKACYARVKDTLTCEELGILLGYSRQEISRRAKHNLLPHKKVGGSYVFFKKELIKKDILPA
ncbi:MAG: hypothetical protein H7A34_05595 [bacterium]|nr:hypothetical protein [bacterium]